MFAYLKQSTASQTRRVGPFVDDTDFKTTETGLTINNTDVKLSKNGAADANKNSGGGTAGSNGMYSLTFDATDTSTVGELSGSIDVAGALVVVFKFWVLEEAVYDDLFGAAAAGYGTAQTGDSFARIGSPAGADIAADIAAAKVDTAAILIDTGSTIPSTLTSMTATIDAIVADTNELQTDWANGGRLDVILDAIVIDTGTTLAGTLTSVEATVNAIVADTNELQTDWMNTGRLDNILDAIVADTQELQTDWVDGGRLDLLVDAILLDTGTTIPAQVGTAAGADIAADIAAIKVDTAATLIDTAEIGAAGAGLTALVADVTKINGSATAAAQLALSADTIVSGIATGTPTTTTMAASALTEATNDHYNGRVIIWTSGVLANQATDITAYTGSTKTFTFTAVTEAAAATDTFIIV